MSKRYIFYNRKSVYAIYYYSTNTVYYNIDFSGTTQLVLMYY